MEYIANTSNSAINTISQVFVVEVKDTDELIDRNNVEYIQNANLMNVSLNGDYQVISEDEAAEVNDMLQYWGSIHMFGTEIVPMSTQLYNTIQSNLKIIETVSLMNGKSKESYIEDEKTFEQLASVIMGE